jgi:hypothetical protein
MYEESVVLFSPVLRRFPIDREGVTIAVAHPLPINRETTTYPTAFGCYNS